MSVTVRTSSHDVILQCERTLIAGKGEIKISDCLRATPSFVGHRQATSHAKRIPRQFLSFASRQGIIINIWESTKRIVKLDNFSLAIRWPVYNCRVVRL